MPTYDYECSKCEHVQEQWHPISERPLIHCDICRGACIKLMGGAEGGFIGMNGGKSTYDFIDYNTTGKPVLIRSKKEWNNHLKKYGLNDDVPNDPKEMARQIKPGMLNVDKNKMKKETRKAIIESVKDKKFISETKQKVKKQLYEARNK